jgi:alkanesulfonate monooxygenase SsuD/methylene tetrahydromethanopterin reductase-like flavin-dependent oxidoreductase (luciferase family)
MRVGVGLPISESFRYQQIREFALIADQGGLDSIWAADHLFHEPANGPRRGIWENWTIMTALAEATQRVEFGPLVMCVPFRSPGMIAWQANALDEVSGGRFVLGLGAGWHEPEFSAFGFEFDRVSLFSDSLEVIAPLLRTGRVDFDGEYANGHATLWPRGPRPNGPPLMIASFGPRMMKLTARWADRFNTAWYGRPDEEFRSEIAKLRAACTEVGRDPAEIEVSAGVTLLDDATAATRQGGQFITGSAEAVAAALAAWRDEGVDEVMCRPEPATPEMYELVASAAELLRAASSQPEVNVVGFDRTVPR